MFEDKDDGEDGDDGEEEDEIVLTFWGGIAWLTVITAFISMLSDNLVGTIEGAAAQWVRSPAAGRAGFLPRSLPGYG